ncbi:MAG TPA: cell division protein ZapB [Dissulfurispiraceae bacterium]|nr:cell division protein ZapB [Dissulfurispiraceae bacterium]
MNDLIPTSIEQKIAQAVEKLRHLKEEKETLEKRVIALELALHEKNAEIERMAQERNTVRLQIETLLNELDSLSTGA